jgi:hypothetical protein
MFGSLWDRWTTAFKVVTPLLHSAFSATQIHGSYIFYRMMRRQQRILREQEGGQQTGVRSDDVGVEPEQSSPVQGSAEIKEAKEQAVEDKRTKPLLTIV